MQDGRKTIMDRPSRSNNEIHGDLRSSVENPVFKIDDVTMTIKDQESADIV